jgi:RNA-directed DNA polymerase
LGIPTVTDRVAQMVVKMYLEPLVEPHCHQDSHGYRPGRSATQAVGVARQRCRRSDRVLDLDIKGFFDNLDHALLMRAVRKHTDLPVDHSLYCEVANSPGAITGWYAGGSGAGHSSRRGVVSPLLANLFLHYAFDVWMQRHHPSIPFERYADDIIVHCKSVRQALWLKTASSRPEL